MSGKWVKTLKLICSIATPIAALIFTVVEVLAPNVFSVDISLTIALGLLTGLSLTVSLDEYGDEEKWEKIESNLSSEWKVTSDAVSAKIDSVSNCRIQTFDNTVDWVCAINKLIETGHHSIVHASLDSATRNKAPRQHASIWNHILAVCKDQRITYSHLIRIRPNNFENLLDRITAGNATNDTYFAYYDLPQSFSFATFEVIDKRYVATRSPFIAGEEPCYMIIDNEVIAEYYLRYFKRLWENAEKIENLSVLTKFYNEFLPNYTDQVLKKRITDKFEALKRAGIMDDI